MTISGVEPPSSPGTANRRSSAVLQARERRVVAALAGVFSTRMFGLFMLLPVLALYADTLPGATPLLGGLAVGAYGLTQALLQIPFGMLSDRYGRKPVILFGLGIFFIGSIVAANAESITVLILGRALQGAGAISAAVTALLADQIRSEARTRAMAIVGGSIGVSFVLSLVLGPLASEWLGVKGVFLGIAGLAVAAALVLVLAVPKSPKTGHSHIESASFAAVVKNPTLLTLDFGVFLLHFMLTAMFVAAPYVLRDLFDIAPSHHWWVYLVVLVASLAGTIPLILVSERSSAPKKIFRLALVVLLAAELALAMGTTQFWFWLVALAAFFAAFNFLEARMPARLSQLAPPGHRGAALGVYASAQFLGAFAGSAAGGILRGSIGGPGVFYLCAAAAGLWWLVQRLLDANEQKT